MRLSTHGRCGPTLLMATMVASMLIAPVYAWEPSVARVKTVYGTITPGTYPGGQSWLVEVRVLHHYRNQDGAPVTRVLKSFQLRADATGNFSFRTPVYSDLPEGSAIEVRIVGGFLFRDNVQYINVHDPADTRLYFSMR